MYISEYLRRTFGQMPGADFVVPAKPNPSGSFPLRGQVISSLRLNDRKLNYYRARRPVPRGQSKNSVSISWSAPLIGISKASYAPIEPHHSPLPLCRASIAYTRGDCVLPVCIQLRLSL